MANIAREPLVYFLLLAGVFFAIFEQVSDANFPGSSQLEEIVVTGGQLKKLTLRFEKVWQRSPSAEELEGVIQSYIREEVLYREALAMGLDRDDGVVRRRLSQKLEFLFEDLASLDEPEEQELQSFLASHVDDYRLPTRFTFQQIYLNTSKRGMSAQTDAVALLEKLRVQDADAANLSDSLMIEHQFDDATDREIVRVLGNEFLQSLLDTPIGSWQGPIASGFGLHLVRIDERVEGKPPALREVRNTVLRDWMAAKRKRVNETLYNAMRSRYKVTIESDKRVRSQQLSMSGTLR